MALAHPPPDLAVLGPELTLDLPHPIAHLRPFVMDPARALDIGLFPVNGTLPAVALFIK